MKFKIVVLAALLCCFSTVEAQKKSKKLSKQEKKELKFQKNREAFIAGNIRIETTEVDFPNDFGRPTRGKLFIYNDRMEFVDFSWLTIRGRIEKLNDYGTVNYFKVVESMPGQPGNAMMTYESQIGSRKFIFQIVHTAEDKIELKLTTPARTNYFYRGRVRPYEN